jgi:hypothetical protein
MNRTDACQTAQRQVYGVMGSSTTNESGLLPTLLITNRWKRRQTRGQRDKERRPHSGGGPSTLSPPPLVRLARSAALHPPKLRAIRMKSLTKSGDAG